MNKINRYALLLPLTLGLASIAKADTPGFESLLQGQQAPLRITASQLDSSYKRLKLGGDSGWLDLKVQTLTAQLGREFNVFYTKGEVLKVGNESYLVAYRPDIEIDPQAIDFHHHGDDGGAPTPATTKLAPKTPLVLSLLNLRTTSSLNEIRSFDAKQDLQTPGREPGGFATNPTPPWPGAFDLGQLHQSPASPQLHHNRIRKNAPHGVPGRA